MMAQYRTKENDMLDAICFKFYGKQSKAVEIVYEANRGLADIGPVLPSGLIIELPEIPSVDTVAAIRLWD
jgi:phage tail protein X